MFLVSQGPLGRVSKKCRKSPRTLIFESFLSLFRVLWNLSFRHFFGTPGREAREDLFETFGGFWGQRASGLLYMAVPIATHRNKLGSWRDKATIQDAFDHDKGQKSQFRGAVSTGGSPLDFFAFSPVFMCNLVSRAP